MTPVPCHLPFLFVTRLKPHRLVQANEKKDICLLIGLRDIQALRSKAIRLCQSQK